MSDEVKEVKEERKKIKRTTKKAPKQLKTCLAKLRLAYDKEREPQRKELEEKLLQEFGSLMSLGGAQLKTKDLCLPLFSYELLVPENKKDALASVVEDYCQSCDCDQCSLIVVDCEVLKS